MASITRGQLAAVLAGRYEVFTMTATTMMVAAARAVETDPNAARYDMNVVPAIIKAADLDADARGLSIIDF